MANAILRTDYYKHNKALRVFVMFNVLLLVQKSGAFEFTVGGSKGWTVPSDPNKPFYNQWAETNRFQIGDSILFSYEANKDSVVRVTKEDYDNCNTANPLQTYSDGHSVFKLTQSGPHYFISGVKENCQKNEKIVVVVLADRKNESSMATTTSAMAIISSISALLASSSLLLL